jgi:hypothetical protein
MFRTIAGIFNGKPKSAIPGATVKFPMTHVHTFKDGTKLYTYKPEHYTEICYRHYEQISELQRYIQAFGMTKQEWSVAIETLRTIAKSALEPKGDKTEALLQVVKYCDHFTAKVEGMKSSFEALSELTFCMFFTIDGEAPATWSPSHNDRKLELLKGEPEVRAFFFSQLTSFTENFAPISASDTANLLLILEDLKRGTAAGLK